MATGAAAPTISLDQVGEITGDWTYEQDRTVSLISAPKLTTVGGNILFNNLTSLSSISLSALQTSQDVKIINCGGLQTVTTGPQYSSARNVSISNTQLTTLGGFGNLTKIASIMVSGNQLLSDITMNINTVTSITIGSNQVANNGLNVAFNNLTMAGSITVNNATAVGLNSLQIVTGSMNLMYNNFQTFSAPNLTAAGGLQLIGNNQLANMSLPALTAINGTQGSFLISNNTALKTIGGFPMLTLCSNNVEFAGVFDNITTLEQIKQVNGAFKVSSTADIVNTVCPRVAALKKSLAIRGAENCTGQSKSASTASGGTTTSDGSSSSSSAAAAILDIPALPVLTAGLGAFLLQFLLSF